MFRLLENKRGIALTLTNLAGLLTAQGKFEAAESGLREALALFRTLQDMPNTVLCLNNLADGLLQQAKLPDAAAILQESLQLAENIRTSLDWRRRCTTFPRWLPAENANTRRLNFSVMSSAGSNKIKHHSVFWSARTFRKIIGISLRYSARMRLSRRIKEAEPFPPRKCATLPNWNLPMPSDDLAFILGLIRPRANYFA